MAAVGPLQFEVVQARMLSEYGVEVRLETLPYNCARWAMAGWEAVDTADAENQLYGVLQLEDSYGRPVPATATHPPRAAHGTRTVPPTAPHLTRATHAGRCSSLTPIGR